MEDTHNVREIQAFLGMAGYYRQHIADFATDARPLSYLTGKGVPCKWEQEEQLAFEELKKRLMTAPILGYPEPDGEYTDASACGVGGVLCQVQAGEERVSLPTTVRL